MNPELEKLIEYALIDGYISDKDRKVLFKKAEKLGFDTDELEIILEGKQMEKTIDSKPKVEKCPACGEILSGLSKVCPSCDYLIDSKSKEQVETLDVSMKKLEATIMGLRNLPAPVGNTAFKTAFFTAITGGIYLIYKKITTKSFFDDNYSGFNNIKILAQNQINDLSQKYGDDRKISEYITQRNAEINEITKERNKTSITIGGLSFAMIAIFGLLIWLMPKQNTSEIQETAKEKTIRLINSDSIGKAKIAVMQIEDKDSKEYYQKKIMLKEIDSLLKMKNYNDAILLASKLHDEGYVETKQNKLDSIINIEVHELVDNKDFSRARERAEIGSYNIGKDLRNLIELAEKIEKDNKKKHKK